MELRGQLHKPMCNVENSVGFSLFVECLTLGLAVVACPFFFPTVKISIGWPFPARLPLGAGFAGTCRAGLEALIPSEAELREFCNMGNAGGCCHMPAERCADGLRFAVARDEESRIVLHYVSERFHEPVEYGRLEYDCQSQSWLAPMHDPCGQRQAECYVEVYLERRPRKPGLQQEL